MGGIALGELLLLWGARLGGAHKCSTASHACIKHAAPKRPLSCILQTFRCRSLIKKSRRHPYSARQSNRRRRRNESNAVIGKHYLQEARLCDGHKPMAVWQRSLL